MFVDIEKLVETVYSDLSNGGTLRDERCEDVPVSWDCTVLKRLIEQACSIMVREVDCDSLPSRDTVQKFIDRLEERMEYCSLYTFIALKVQYHFYREYLRTQH